MNKVSEAILSSLGHCWETFICSSLLARLMEEVPANKVLLGCNLTFWEVSQQTYVQALLASLGVVIGQNLEPFSGGRVHKKLGVV